MEASSFWLISIEESYVSVSLVNSANGRSVVLSVGPQKDWLTGKEDSLAVAIDESLSEAATSANIPEESEPVHAAFVLPSFWIGSDGKITPEKLSLIKDLCKDLTLKPIGFIADDEAIVEHSNKADTFPASFILLHLGKNNFTLSLVYLGQIKERIRKSFSGDFKAEYVEAALIELKSESTLPPQIIVFGQASHENFNALKDFAWVGKKNIETFLHFPEVKLHSPKEIINIFVKTITSQMNPQLIEESPQKVDEIEEAEVVAEEEIKPEIEEKESNLEEVEATDLGFFEAAPPSLPVIESIDEITEQQVPPTINDIEETKVNFEIPKIKFSFGFLKNIHLPKFNKFGTIALALSPLLIIVPVLFSKAKVTIFVTPYTFNKQINVKLDSTTTSIDIDKSIIPVTKQTFEIPASETVKTTGQKTIGEKAKGNIIIFNLLEKTQTLPQGTILIDSTGKNFELSAPISVTPGAFDINEGILKSGQTKASAAAVEVGPDYNITKDNKLKFKDFPESSLIAKTDGDFSGGTKDQISAVSDQDKKDLEKKIDQKITDLANQKIKDEVSKLSGVVQGTLQSKKSKIDYNREIGEEANELTANVQATVTVLLLDPKVKEEVINKFLSKEADFDKVEINQNNFTFNLKVDKIDNDVAQGLLTINGKALPKTDMAKLKKTLSGRSTAKAGALIRKNIPRAYNFNIKTNFQLIKFINPLPFSPQNITIDFQSESL
ncbi:MAG: hypothetical protein WCG91_00515 [Candidatus Shapirobacteria bacterium]